MMLMRIFAHLFWQLGYICSRSVCRKPWLRGCRLSRVHVWPVPASVRQQVSNGIQSRWWQHLGRFEGYAHGNFGITIFAFVPEKDMRLKKKGFFFLFMKLPRQELSKNKPVNEQLVSKHYSGKLIQTAEHDSCLPLLRPMFLLDRYGQQPCVWFTYISMNLHM